MPGGILLSRDKVTANNLKKTKTFSNFLFANI